MNTELWVLALGCILALVHIMWAGQAKTSQYGVQWNMSARDGDMPPLHPLPARLVRAQANYFETFPIVIALTLALTVTAHNGGYGAAGAVLWLVARVVYLPLYAGGVPRWRSVVFGVSMIGIGMMLVRLLAGLLHGGV